MDIFSETLKKYISESDLNNEEIAKKIGVTQPYISKMQNNRNATPPSDETLIKLCEVLHIPKSVEKELLILANLNRTPDIIKNKLEEVERENAQLKTNKPEINLSEKIGMVQIPIYGSVSAGHGEIAMGEITGYAYTTADDYIEGMFSISVKGDSMETKIPEGALVEVIPQHELSNKDIGIFIINGDEGVVKQFFLESDFIRLVSFNQNYRDIIIMPNREDFKIVGKVKSVKIEL